MKDVYSNDGCVAYLKKATDKSPNGWDLDGLKTFPTRRGKGYARDLLKEICADADAEDVTLFLAARAEPWDSLKFPGLSQPQLEAFYRKFGFREYGTFGHGHMRR